MLKTNKFKKNNDKIKQSIVVKEMPMQKKHLHRLYYFSSRKKISSSHRQIARPMQPYKKTAAGRRLEAHFQGKEQEFPRKYL